MRRQLWVYKKIIETVRKLEPMIKAVEDKIVTPYAYSNSVFSAYFFLIEIIID